MSPVPRPSVVVGAGLALAATLIVVPLGGGAGAGDPVAGRRVFATAACGVCHTFGPAGSKGTIGPRLDGIALTAAQAAAIVTAGRGGMPSFRSQLTAQQIADVAAFVTGTPAAPVPGTPGASAPAPAPAAGTRESAATVTVTAGIRGVRLRPATVTAGLVTLVIRPGGLRAARVSVAAVTRGTLRPVLAGPVASRVVRRASVRMAVRLSAGAWLVTVARRGGGRRHALLTVTAAPSPAGVSSPAATPDPIPVAAPASPAPEPTPADLTRALCGQCHTLAAAGISGTIGPNLDAVAPSAPEVRAVMRTGDGVMPSFTGSLTADQIAAIADFVARSARRGG